MFLEISSGSGFAPVVGVEPLSLCNLLPKSSGRDVMERETGLEPATSSLGKWAMFCFQ